MPKSSRDMEDHEEENKEGIGLDEWSESGDLFLKTEYLLPQDIIEKCDEYCIERFKNVLRIIDIFRTFFETLAFYEIPLSLDRIIPRETSFYIVAEMMARATQFVFPTLLKVMEESSGEKYEEFKQLLKKSRENGGLDALLIHNKCHSRMRDILGAPVVVFHAKKEGDKIVLETHDCPFKNIRKHSPLVCASCLGVVLGSTRFLIKDKPIYLVRTKKEVEAIPEGSVVITQVRRAKECRIEVFER